MTSREILLIITSIGAIQSILLGLYFFATKYKTRTINVILALLLISLGIRVAKSTLFIFSSQVPLVILNIGFGAHALSAPLFYLYIKYFKTESGVQIWEVVHLVPAIMVCVVAPMIRGLCLCGPTRGFLSWVANRLLEFSRLSRKIKWRRKTGRGPMNKIKNSVSPS